MRTVVRRWAIELEVRDGEQTILELAQIGRYSRISQVRSPAEYGKHCIDPAVVGGYGGLKTATWGPCWKLMEELS
jgi:hypothetical protein